MAKERTAAVFVEQDWYDNTLRFLLDRAKSTSTTGTHLLIGELLDAGHHRGIWFKNVPTRQIKDGVIVKMDYMVPWRVILGAGLVDEPETFRMGFQGTDSTTLS